MALIHCGPTLPDPAEGVNRHVLPSFWRFRLNPDGAGRWQGPNATGMVCRSVVSGRLAFVRSCRLRYLLGRGTALPAARSEGRDERHYLALRTGVGPEWPLVKAAIIAGAAFPVATAVGDLYEAAARSIE